MKTATKKVPTTISLEERLLKELKNEAKAERRTLSAQLEQILAEKFGMTKTK